MRSRIIQLLFAAGMLFLSTASFAQVGVSIRIAPPPLPVYEQPICPGDGYIWTPGYWEWSDEYYWVPGTWVIAPEPGFLWTPAYWGWGGNGFIFNEGYWGPSVGFYGGIDYGFGYFGHGYEGGRWENGHFFYNTALNNVNVNVIHNVYNTRVNRTGLNRVSYNGGNGGINARATAQEEAAGRDRHIPAAAPQTQHALAARNDPQQRFSANRGAPPVAATPAPGAFKGLGVVPARQPAAAAFHPKELPPVERPASPATGNPKLDQKYQNPAGKSNRAAEPGSAEAPAESGQGTSAAGEDSRLLKEERSKWSNNTSNKRSNCSKNTRSRYSRCSRGSSQAGAGIVVVAHVVSQMQYEVKYGTH